VQEARYMRLISWTLQSGSEQYSMYVHVIDISLVDNVHLNLRENIISPITNAQRTDEMVQG
jgi:hypothetical protein